MNLWTIAVFEFQRYFKWKQEIISIGLMLLSLVLMSAWPLVKTWLDNDYKIALVSSISAPKIRCFTSIESWRPCSTYSFSHHLGS